LGRGEILTAQHHNAAGDIRKDKQMRLQVYIIATLSCLLFWGGVYHVSRDVYRAAHTAGVIPNLHIKYKIGQIGNYV
jgi:hypothetical protein